MALSVQNAFAVLQGLWGSQSPFVRTPKFSDNDADKASYLRRKINWVTVLEITILCYFLYGIGLSLYLGDYFMMLFFIMIGYGLAYLVYQSLLLIIPRPTPKVA